MIDKHTIALISIIGCSLDLLGAMYLAYDLLGGEHGPLRTLTRAVTYGGLFGVGYGLGLGPSFGLAAGATAGVTLGWEFSRARSADLNQAWYDGVSAVAPPVTGSALLISMAPDLNRLRNIKHSRPSLRLPLGIDPRLITSQSLDHAD
jgi:hypothetical protein